MLASLSRKSSGRMSETILRQNRTGKKDAMAIIDPKKINNARLVEDIDGMHSEEAMLLFLVPFASCRNSCISFCV